MPQPALRDDLSTDQWMKVRRDQPQRGPAELSSYFGYQPEMTASEEAELRAQQAAEREQRERWDQEHQVLLAPVFGPELLLFGAEAAGALAARAAAKRGAALPPQTFKKHALFPISGGDNWAARVGRRAHQDLKAKVDAKPGWDGERSLRGPNGEIIRPDALGPVRRPPAPGDAPKRILLELKPNTASGRRAGVGALKRYGAVTKNRGRVVYYNPRDYR
jgi:hypothetical protein